MAKGNRFKSSAPTVDFNDPSILTAVPAPLEKKEESTPAVPKNLPEKITRTPETVSDKKDISHVDEAPKAEITQPAAPKREKAPAKPKATAGEGLSLDAILAGMSEKKSAAKSYAVYLDNDVVAALDKVAAKSKLSRSKALNEILRSVLLK